MATTLADPIFHDDAAARAHLEKVRWPDGARCLHCGSADVLRMEGKAHRVGAFHCRACRGQFSVTVGSVFESSHLPLHKWLLATHLLAASKKGMSSMQLSRMLSVTYKTAWFMSHRIREAMTEKNLPPVGGEGKIVEADEAYHGKVEVPIPSAQRKGRPALKRDLAKQKRPILALVERGGEVRAEHVRHVTAATVGDFLSRNARLTSRLHTDESNLYPRIGGKFAKHETVNHGGKEYARGDVTTNSIEGFFGIFKRGMSGVYQHCSEQHFQRYLNEFSFRHNNRIALGINDDTRALTILQGIGGKRLTYRRAGAA